MPPGVRGCYQSCRPVLQGAINRVARCYRVLFVAPPGVTGVLSIASPGVTGCYQSRRPVLQGVICRVARCYRVLSIGSPGVIGCDLSRRPVLQGLIQSRRPVLTIQGAICYVSWCYAVTLLHCVICNLAWRCVSWRFRVLSIASPGVTWCYLSRRPVLQGVIRRVARCYRVLSVASPGVTGCYLSRRPVLQGVICRVARCYRVFELSCSCLLVWSRSYMNQDTRGYGLVVGWRVLMAWLGWQLWPAHMGRQIARLSLGRQIARLSLGGDTSRHRCHWRQRRNEPMEPPSQRRRQQDMSPKYTPCKNILLTSCYTSAMRIDSLVLRRSGGYV